MSDIKIQNSPTPEDGAQTPLQVERRGNEGFNQNTLSFCRGVEVPASSQTTDRKFSPGLVNGVGEPSGRREPATVRNMSVTGVDVVVKPVGANHLQGSNQGDHRSKAAPAVLPPNPGPRSS